MKSKKQGRSEGTSSLAFEVLKINCQIYFINLFIFNRLTLNIKMFVFKLFDVKFLFSENHVFCKQKRTACLWSYGRASLVSNFKLTRENDDLFFKTNKILRHHTLCKSILKCGLPTKGIELTRFVLSEILGVPQL